MRKVYFDECGNTGQNLLDESDPIFVLASCSFEPDEEGQISEHFKDFQGPELKFSRLRKSPAGQRSVLSFLDSSQVNTATTVAILFHKPHMIVGKYCDLILEPSMRAVGIDFYARGANIATANLLATTMPVFLTPKTWSDFLSQFVRVTRERTVPLFNEWAKHAEIIYSHLKHTQPDMADFIAPVFLMRDAEEFFSRLSDDELDPLVPAYQVMAGHWGKSIGARFDLIADESKVLAKVRDRFLTMSDPTLKSVTVGYDRRKFDFPLKVSDIVAVDSTMHQQVQFADILGGAIACAAKARARSPLQEGSFAQKVFEVCFNKKLIINSIWPSHEIDPKDLGTDRPPGADDIDAATYVGKILQGDPETRNISG